jgi:hypothetical protein
MYGENYGTYIKCICIKEYNLVICDKMYGTEDYHVK